MFREQRRNSGYTAVDAATRVIELEEGEIEQTIKNKEYKVQPCGGYTTKLFTEAYTLPKTRFKPPPQKPVTSEFNALRSTVNEWARLREQTEKASRILRTVRTQEIQAKGLFIGQAPVVVPTGPAAAKAYTDLVRITALLNRSDYVQLVKPDVVNAIAATVTPRISTPLFNAFLAFMRLPDPTIEANKKSKDIFVDLVRRAVLSANPAYQWRDFVSLDALVPQPGTAAPTSSPTSSPTTSPQSSTDTSGTPAAPSGFFGKLFDTFGTPGASRAG